MLQVDYYTEMSNILKLSLHRSPTKGNGSAFLDEQSSKFSGSPRTHGKKKKLVELYEINIIN